MEVKAFNNSKLKRVQESKSCTSLSPAISNGKRIISNEAELKCFFSSGSATLSHSSLSISTSSSAC